MGTPAQVVVATRNAGKLREFAELLGNGELALCDLSAYPDAPDVAETGSTYRENALIKARAAARHTGLPALADDSGIEVDALDGAPGVRSARFAEDCHSGSGDAANVACMLAKLRGVPAERRTARFRCVLALVTPDRRELVVDGVCEGAITDEPRGDNGFGYDPIVRPIDRDATFAELAPAVKQSISHRAAACRKLREHLPAFLAASS